MTKHPPSPAHTSLHISPSLDLFLFGLFLSLFPLPCFYFSLQEWRWRMKRDHGPLSIRKHLLLLFVLFFSPWSFPLLCCWCCTLSLCWHTQPRKSAVKQRKHALLLSNTLFLISTVPHKTHTTFITYFWASLFTTKSSVLTYLCLPPPLFWFF